MQRREKGRKTSRCFCSSWRKQAGLVCIVWVTFVKWALLFQLLHYSNTCYWDHWRAHWHQCGVRLSHRVDLGGGRGRGGQCAFVLGVKAIDTYVTKWGLKRLWHLPPILTMHSDVRPQLVMRSVRTCRNKDTSRCVCVCLGTSHCEPQGQNSATCAGAGVPTAAETRVHQLDLLPLWVWSEGERRDTTGQWEGSVMWCCDWVSCFFILCFISNRLKLYFGFHTQLLFQTDKVEETSVQLKGHHVVFERTFKLRMLLSAMLMRLLHKVRNTYSFHNWINKLFLEENKVPRTLFEARKVTGSATCKQSKTVWNCVFLQEIIITIIIIIIKATVREDLSLLNKNVN